MTRDDLTGQPGPQDLRCSTTAVARWSGR